MALEEMHRSYKDCWSSLETLTGGFALNVIWASEGWSKKMWHTNCGKLPMTCATIDFADPCSDSWREYISRSCRLLHMSAAMIEIVITLRRLPIQRTVQFIHCHRSEAMSPSENGKLPVLEVQHCD